MAVERIGGDRTAPLGPERSGGRPGAAFLPREEWPQSGQGRKLPTGAAGRRSRRSRSSIRHAPSRTWWPRQGRSNRKGFGGGGPSSPCFPVGGNTATGCLPPFRDRRPPAFRLNVLADSWLSRRHDTGLTGIAAAGCLHRRHRHRALAAGLSPRRLTAPLPPCFPTEPVTAPSVRSVYAASWTSKSPSQGGGIAFSPADGNGRLAALRVPGRVMDTIMPGPAATAKGRLRAEGKESGRLSQEVRSCRLHPQSTKRLLFGPVDARARHSKKRLEGDGNPGKEPLVEGAHHLDVGIEIERCFSDIVIDPETAIQASSSP